jgi:tRNA(Glu) U13 pseudouridine synthase TruD
VTTDGESFVREAFGREAFGREAFGGETNPTGNPIAGAPDLRAVRLRFSLPAGGYATVVIEALLQGAA